LPAELGFRQGQAELGFRQGHPTRQGFGRILLEKAAAQEFGVLPKVRFAPEGLIYEIEAPLLVVAASNARGTETLERKRVIGPS
jgi:hypothetical protein